MLKVSDNPPVLHPDGAGLDELVGPWWVARTRSRQEKKLAWWLNRHNISYFLPLREKMHRSKGRRFKTVVPVFTGYLFFCGPEEHRYQALTSNCIAQVLTVVDQEGLISDLGQLYAAIVKGAPLDPHPYLKTGQRCQVVRGAFAGLEGVVVRRQNVTRLVLQVDMLGQAAAVEIDADMIEPASS